MQEAAVQPADAQALAARAERATTLFTALTQALRALQLYGPANQSTQRAIDLIREQFQAVWDQGSELDVEVRPETLVVAGRPVYQNPGHADSIAFLMFRDGIRTLSFRPGFEQEELPRFLLVLHQARYQPSDADDLVTRLWDEDFLHLRHGYIDADASLEDDSQAQEVAHAAASATRNLALQIHDASARMLAQSETGDQDRPSTGDPAALSGSGISMQKRSLHLDPEALVYLQRELEEEMRRDLRQDVVNALLDSFEVPDPRAQSEILQILAQFMPQLLAERQLRLVTAIATELRVIAEQPGCLDDARRLELDRLFDNLAGTSAVADFLAALDAGDVQRDLDCIEPFAAHLGPPLVQPLLRAREKAAGKELRAALEATTERLAREHPAAAAAALRAEDPLVVRGALRLAVGLGPAVALPEAVRLLGHVDTRVRLGAVEIVVALGTELGLEALVGALGDLERGVRVAALWGLATWQYAPAAPRLERLLDDKGCRDLDSDERMAVLDAYARIKGSAAIDRLGKLLHAKFLLKPSEPTDVRACAARALGIVGTDAAKAMIERARDDRDPEVRRAVQRALRKMGAA